MNTLKWTKKKPVTEGWYWMRKKQGLDGGYEDSIEYVRNYGGNMCILNWEVPDKAEWAGPIEKPIQYFDVEEYYKE